MDIRVFRKMLLFFLPQNSFILPVSLQVIVLRHLEAKMLIGFFTLQAPGSKAVNSAFSPCKKKHRGCGASFFVMLHYHIIMLYIIMLYIITLLPCSAVSAAGAGSETAEHVSCQIRQSEVRASCQNRQSDTLAASRGR